MADRVVSDLLQDLVDSHFNFYKQVNDDQAFAKVVLDWLFERYLRGAIPPQTPDRI